MSGASSSLTNRLLAGRYRLVRIAGKGGMGVVWEAFDQTLDRRVAIKLVLPAHSEDEHMQRLARLERERRVLIELSQHPGIVTLFDILTEPLGYVMEWIEGYDLESWLCANPGPRPPALVASIFGRILDAVDYAHTKGVIHRDLKSSNIFLQNLGDRTSVRVMDFGLARIVQQESDITTGRLLLGTPQYMAPEQVMGEPPTPQTDIYALGVLLYECLTGELPLEDRGESPVPMLMDKVRNELPSPQEKYPELSEELTQVIVKATRLSQDERYATCAEFADALFAALPQDDDRNSMRLETRALGIVPEPQEIFSGAPTTADTSNISLATLYGHHQDFSGAQHLQGTLLQAGGMNTTLINQAPADARPPSPHAGQSTESHPYNSYDGYDEYHPPNAPPAPRVKIAAAALGLFILLAVLLVGLQRNIAKQRLYANASQFEGIPWIIRGDKDRRNASLDAMITYRDIIDDWNEGDTARILEGYREPLRCYYNQPSLLKKDIVLQPLTRTIQGVPAPPFEPKDLFISSTGDNYITFVESGVAGKAQLDYVRVIQLTRRTSNSPWRISVEANRSAHDCYDSFDTHYQKWRNGLSNKPPIAKKTSIAEP